MVAKDEGHVVSSNVAPASNTQSVLKNPLLAMAFDGADLIPPLFIFDPDTSNVLMTWLLLHDLRTQSSPPPAAAGVVSAVPAPLDDASHPLMLFASTAVHNGIWSCAYQLRSVLEAVLLFQYAHKLRPHASAVAVALAAMFAAMRVPQARL